MNRWKFLLGAVMAAGTAGMVAACESADMEGTPLAGDSPAASTVNSQAGTSTECTEGTATLAPEDPEKYPKCSGKGVSRCIPKNKLPANFASQLKECSEGGPGLCVPDALVKTGGAAPPTCASIGGAEGVCLSLAVPQVEQYETLLPQASCAADEKCAPCINPLTKQPSGACLIGKASTCTNGGSGNTGSTGTGSTGAGTCPHQGPPVVDPATFPSCHQAGGAVCVPSALVPAAMASQLKACTEGQGGLCVPKKFVAAGGNFIPKTCASLAGAEGRCLDLAIPQVDGQKDRLPKADCDESEKCVPCFDPITGAETGSCKLSCDPGPDLTKPKATFKACCDVGQNPAGRGKCVPTEIIPDALESKLSNDDDTCAAGSLCVPNENLDDKYKPVTCTGSGTFTGDYTGVCVSDCVNFSFIERLGTSKGSCNNGFKCAPCKNPLTGQATGAPGCPP